MSFLPQIYEIAQSCGFSLVKVAQANELTTERDHYLQWLADGKYGEMHYLNRDPIRRYSPQAVLPGAKSIILVALNYYEATSGEIKVAQYARGKADYHKVFEKKLKLMQQKLEKLFNSGQYKFYVDYGPLMERPYAAAASMGFIGKNTLLITKEFGSWVLLGEILTTLEITPEPSEKHGSCGSCTRCLDICPTKALRGPYDLDSRLCISYLTIEYKGSIPLPLRKKIGTWLFGCDLCQDICPHNSRAKAYAKNAWQDIIVTEDLQNPTYIQSINFLRKILTIKNDEEYRTIFQNTPFLRAKRIGLIRNACIVAGNLGDKSLLPLLQALVHDASELIQEHAQWAIDEINN